MTPIDPAAPRARHAAIWLLVALGALFVTSPFLQGLPRGDLVEATLLSAVMVAAIVAVGGQRRALIVGLVLLVPALGGKWLNQARPDLAPPVLHLVASIVFFGFVVARLLVFLVRSPRVDANVLCAGVAGFLLLGLLWVPAYAAVARLDPAAFALSGAPGAPATLDAFGAFYFSMITLCTVGYGDVTPVSSVARMLAVLEAVSGVFYMAVLVSRLVSMHAASRPTPEPAPPSAAGPKAPGRGSGRH